MMEFKDNGMIHFEVRNVTQADIGKYRCHCSNALGYDNSIAQLNLESKKMNAVLFCLEKLCFAAQSVGRAVSRSVHIGQSLHSARRQSSSDRSVVQSWRHRISHSMSTDSNLLPVATAGLLFAFMTLYVCIHFIFGDYSASSFPCDDNGLKSIAEYVFKCGQS